MIEDASFPEVEAMRTVAKKPKSGSKEEADKQRVFQVKFAKAIEERILAAAETMTLDPTSFLRLIIREQLPTYEKRASRIRDGQPPEGD